MEEIIQTFAQKYRAKDIIFSSTCDESECLLVAGPEVSSRYLIFAPCANYSTISKILIVIGIFGVHFNVNYHSLVYSGITKEIDGCDVCTHDVLIQSTYIFIAMVIIFSIPGSFLFSKYPKFSVWLIVVASIVGASMKLMLPNNLLVFYIGQTLIACSAIYAYVATPGVGSLIFDEEKNKIFLACSYTLPLFLNISVKLFVQYFQDSYLPGELISILNAVGLCLSLLTLPLLFVNENWKVSNKNDTTIDYLHELRLPNIAAIDNLSQAFRTVLFWNCVGIYIMVTSVIYIIMFD